MAAVHSRCCVGITIHGNDACYCSADVCNICTKHFTCHCNKKNPEVDLIHDGSPQLQFDTLVHLSAIALG